MKHESFALIIFCIFDRDLSQSDIYIKRAQSHDRGRNDFE